MANSFGTLFRITTFGESHGPAVGVIVDGCPPGLPVDLETIQRQLDRRRPGQSRLVTQRRESDTAEILSGIFEGYTTGTPIMILVRNADARSRDYEEMRRAYRPSHADYTYDIKYGRRDHRGGGRSSARETVGRVAAGAIAAKLLRRRAGVEILSWVHQVADVVAPLPDDHIDLSHIEATPVRCPDPPTAKRMISRIEAARKDGDSLGGVVASHTTGVPVGLGEPVFDRLEADLAKAMLSLPACKGFEIGSGFAAADFTGSTHNDLFYRDDAGRIRTRTNRSGGIQGGISNGEPIELKAAFKPTATILKPQPTVDVDGEQTTLKGRGRHDPCVLPRAVPLVDAMVALVLADHLLRQEATDPSWRSRVGLADATGAETAREP